MSHRQPRRRGGWLLAVLVFELVLDLEDLGSEGFEPQLYIGHLLQQLCVQHLQQPAAAASSSNAQTPQDQTSNRMQVRCTANAPPESARKITRICCWFSARSSAARAVALALSLAL